MQENSLAHNCAGWRGVTRYERGGRFSCVTVGGDQGWSVAVVALREAEVSRLKKAPGLFGAPRLLVWMHLWGEGDFSVDWIVSGRIWSGGVSWLLGHVVSSSASQFLTTTDVPRFFSCRSLRKRSRKIRVGRGSFRLDANGQRRILDLNAGRLNLLGDRAARWRLACWSIDFLKICNRCFFRS